MNEYKIVMCDNKIRNFNKGHAINYTNSKIISVKLKFQFQNLFFSLHFSRLEENKKSVSHLIMLINVFLP